MKEYGVVIKNDGDGIAVKMQNSFSCEGCSACHISEEKDHILFIQQDFPVRAGEKVEIEIKPAFAVTSALLLFFLPLVMLIVGYYLFQNFLPLFGIVLAYRGIVGAFIGFILSYVFIYFYDRHLKNDSSLKNVHISRIIK
jgi:positive regulator of sigma E activity